MTKPDGIESGAPRPEPTETGSDSLEAFARQLKHPGVLIGRQGEVPVYCVFHLEARDLRHPKTNKPVRFEIRINQRTDTPSLFIVNERGEDWPVSADAERMRHLRTARPVYDDLTGLRVEKLQALLH